MHARVNTTRAEPATSMSSPPPLAPGDLLSGACESRRAGYVPVAPCGPLYLCSRALGPAPREPTASSAGEGVLAMSGALARGWSGAPGLSCARCTPRPEKEAGDAEDW